jgi:hypothetical protein
MPEAAIPPRLSVLHFAAYNCVKRHNSIRMTPAMALGVQRDFWTYSELVERAS